MDPSTTFKTTQKYSSNSFAIKIENLEVGTKYYAKAYTKNSAGEVTSEVIEFKTTSTVPSVLTVGASEISAYSAVLSGEVLDDNGETVTECGFVWLNGTSTPTTSSNVIKLEGVVGEISATLSSLKPDQKYTFRAYAKNSKGTAYGDVITFTTTKSPGTGEGFTGDEIEW
jgi:phage-related protein